MIKAIKYLKDAAYIPVSSNMENLDKSGNLTVIGKNRESERSRRKSVLPIVCYCDCYSYEINHYQELSLNLKCKT